MLIVCPFHIHLWIAISEDDFILIVKDIHISSHASADKRALRTEKKEERKNKGKKKERKKKSQTLGVLSTTCFVIYPTQK